MNNLTNQDVIKLIKPLLKHDIWKVRDSTIQVLGDIFKAMTAKDTLEQIASLLKDDDKNVRYSVMKILEYVLDVDPSLANKECNCWIDGWTKHLIDLNSYNEENMRGNMNSIEDKEVKQFCYDSSNPCPYCDTKFKHTALHCAVYFSDIESDNRTAWKARDI